MYIPTWRLHGIAPNSGDSGVSAQILSLYYELLLLCLIALYFCIFHSDLYKTFLLQTSAASETKPQFSVWFAAAGQATSDLLQCQLSANVHAHVT